MQASGDDPGSQKTLRNCWNTLETAETRQPEDNLLCEYLHQHLHFRRDESLPKQYLHQITNTYTSNHIKVTTLWGHVTVLNSNVQPGIIWASQKKLVTAFFFILCFGIPLTLPKTLMPLKTHRKTKAQMKREAPTTGQLNPPKSVMPSVSSSTLLLEYDKQAGRWCVALKQAACTQIGRQVRRSRFRQEWK